MKYLYHLIIVFFFVFLVFSRIFLVISDLFHSLSDLNIFLVCLFIPVDIVLASYLLDLFPVRISLLDKRVPSLDVKAFVIIEFGLLSADGQVEG